jgi:hypothetical protein
MARVDDESVQAMAMGKVFKDNVRSPKPISCTPDLIIYEQSSMETCHTSSPAIPLTHCGVPLGGLCSPSRRHRGSTPWISTKRASTS